jgi:hypothetical protein
MRRMLLKYKPKAAAVRIPAVLWTMSTDRTARRMIGTAIMAFSISFFGTEGLVLTPLRPGYIFPHLVSRGRLHALKLSERNTNRAGRRCADELVALKRSEREY